MELTRNHYFVIGIVLVLFGIQIRLVDSYVLNESASARLMEKAPKTLASGYPFSTMMPAVTRKTISPAPWVGFAVIAVGGVLVLHALAMPKTS